MKRIVVAFGALLLCACLVTSCGMAKTDAALASKPSLASETNASSKPPELLSSAAATERGTTLVLYRKLGDLPPTKVEAVQLEGEIYTLETDYHALLQRWQLSTDRYVCIGWFLMDENDQPTNWVGEGKVRLKAGEENRLVAVLNTYQSGEQISGGFLEIYQTIDGGAPERKNVIAGIEDFPLGETPKGLLRGETPDPEKYRFVGWKLADETGNPVSDLTDLHLTMQAGERKRITAVFESQQAKQ